MDSSALSSRNLADLGKLSAHDVLSGLVNIENLPLLASGIAFLVRRLLPI